MSFAVIKRAGKRFSDQQMTDAAATLTYYALMSMLPLLVVATSLFSLVGDASTVTSFVGYVADHGADQTTQDAISQLMTNITESSSGAAGLALLVSVVLALNSAAAAFGAAGRALNSIEELEEDRGIVRRRLTDMATALVASLLLVLVIVALFLGGGVARDLFDEIGFGQAAADIWNYLRWPVALLAAIAAFAIVYSYSPHREAMTFRFITWGTVSGVVLWIVASIGFSVYIQNFGTYGAAYGVFGATIVLLLWLYISSAAFLFGAQLDYASRRPEDEGRGTVQHEKLPR